MTKCSLGYNIYRRREENGMIYTERLQKLDNNLYTLNKSWAKIFYNLNDAESALVISKVKGRKITDIISKGIENSSDKKEKQSWSEF